MIPACRRASGLLVPLRSQRSLSRSIPLLRSLASSNIASRQRRARIDLKNAAEISERGLGHTRRLATAVDINPVSSSLPFLTRPPAIPLPDIPSMRSPFPPPPPIPKASGPVDLILPPTEDRAHRYLVLENGLEVVLVSDPTADKSAASMDVGVGHLNDPDNLPGCAHFCEHLLFMGTKKYPAENEYQVYLTTHNGHSNAYTAMTSTVYFFDVGSDALEGALDRFAGFFIEPLFNEDCTEREIKAVDSEHKKNLQSDMWRFFQMEKHVLRPDHPYHKFGTGNYETLFSTPKSQSRNPRQELMSWWEKYYCSRRMKLAVVGKEGLDELEKMVREKFGGVAVRSEGAEEVGPEGVRVVFSESPMGEDQMGVVTFTKPVQDSRGLEITFPFPDTDHLYQSKPGHYVTHFLGHEGKGSILSYLKNKGYVNFLRAGLSHGAAGFDFMKVTVDLTIPGLENWKEVALTIFKYITLLRSQSPSETTFDEIKSMAEISFRFAEKAKNGRYATAVSNMMQRPFPRDKIVSGGSRLESFNKEELAAALRLLDPRMAVVGVTCRDLPKDIEGTWDKKEPIYGTEYKQIKLDDQFIKEAMGGKAIPQLQLPGQNKFIPERLDVNKFDVLEPSLRPELLRDSSLSRLWFKQDDQFWLPKANVDILLHSPILQNTPRNAVLGRLFADLFRDSVTEETYDADMAELSFNLWYAGDSIGVGAGGFSDKLAVLLENMLGKMRVFEVDQRRFEGVVDELRLNWKNFALQDPYRQVGWWSAYVTAQTSWTQEERLMELDVVTPADVKAFSEEVLSRLFIETLIHGNTTPEGAKEIQDMLERVLNPRALAEGEKNTLRSLCLPPSSEQVWSVEIPNKSEVNSAITYSLQIGELSDRPLRAALQLFAQIAHEPTFDRLRTKEQLGYIVDSASTHSVGVMGFRFLVQSERDPVYVETRIEAFLDELKGLMEEMEDAEFEKHKTALIAKKEEKPKNLGEETKRYWASIGDRYYEFGKRQTDVIHLKKTTKQDVLDLFMKYIHPSSPTRSKLSTHMTSTYRGVKFDPNSAASLVEGFTTHSIPVDQAALQKLMTSQPDLTTVQGFARDLVGKAGLDEGAKAELESMISGLKGKEAGVKEQGDEDVKLRPANVYIEDIHVFKAGLIPSKAPIPLEPLRAVARL